MSTTICIIGIIIATSWSWLIYEAWTAPIMPDDYGIIEYEKQQTTIKTKK